MFKKLLMVTTVVGSLAMPVMAMDGNNPPEVYSQNEIATMSVDDLAHGMKAFPKVGSPEHAALPRELKRKVGAAQMARTDEMATTANVGAMNKGAADVRQGHGAMLDRADAAMGSFAEHYGDIGELLRAINAKLQTFREQSAAGEGLLNGVDDLTRQLQGLITQTRPQDEALRMEVEGVQRDIAELKTTREAMEPRLQRVQEALGHLQVAAQQP